MMTPTFAAGLGIVIAAALASSVTRSVLRFNGPPDKGRPCAVHGCQRPGSGTLASARPGQRLLTPVQAPAHPTPTRGRQPQAGGSQAGNVVVLYQTIRENGDGGFYGEIVLASRPGHTLGRWTFRFSYPSAQITSVWDGAPMAHGAHAATVTGQPQGGSPWGQQVQIMFSVAGPAGPPAGCSFDGQSCRYQVSQAAGNQGGGGYGGGSAGSGYGGGYRH